MHFNHRSYQKELLDRDDVPFHAIRQNMHELNVINTWLGGHSITIKGLRNLAESKKTITVCEIGCGGGDNLFALKNWCRKHDISAAFSGIDKNSHCIEYARSQKRNEGFDFIVNDYRDHFFAEKPDIIFSSLFCHHFSNEEIVAMLKWMKENSGIGFFINDLHRNFFAYHSIKWLTKFFSGSYLVKNDAPLSVLRGFSKKELELLLHQANINNYSVKWKWAFRWLVVSSNKTND